MSFTKYKQDKYIIYLLFALNVIYNLQGTLYSAGSFISKFVLLLIILISLFFFAKTLLFKQKDIFYLAWTIFFLLNIFGFVFTGDISNGYHFSMFKNTLVLLSSFYPFYYFARMGSLDKKNLIFFLLLMLPITLLQYHYNLYTISEESLKDPDNIVNNISYSLVVLMPFVFLIRKKRPLSMILMLLIMFYIIQGAKRGAIVVGIAVLIIYFYNLLKSAEKQSKTRDYFLILISIVILTIFSYNTIVNNDFLMLRFNQMFEGNSSGRDVIYSNIWNSWLNTNNPLEFLFGFGYAGSLMLTNGSFAHNDWLEVISNFGLLGGLIYLALFFIAFKYCFKKEWYTEKKILMFTIVFSWFLTSMFSMWYTSLSASTQAMLLGYLIGSKSNKLI